jgi:hypothetical protein
MGLLTCRRAWATALVAGALTTGCGSSVADADRPDPTRSQPVSSSPFCTAVQANLEAIRPLNTLIGRGGGAPPEELSNTVDAVRRTGEDMLDTAPNEIRPDVERTVEAVDLQLDALLASGGDRDAVSRDPELAAQLQAPELRAASERVQTYVTRNCTPGGSTGS